MNRKKIIIISIIINILTIGIIYNFIKKDYINNEKIIVKAMTETEHENTIKSLNKSHDEFVHYIEGCKTKIASAITDMGVATSNQSTPETMVNNIRSIARDAYSISYDNSSSNLASTNVQTAVDELKDTLEDSNTWKYFNEINGKNSLSLPESYIELLVVTTPNRDAYYPQDSVIPFAEGIQARTLYWESNSWVSFLVNYLTKTFTVEQATTDKARTILYYR